MGSRSGEGKGLSSATVHEECVSEGDQKRKLRSHPTVFAGATISTATRIRRLLGVISKSYREQDEEIPPTDENLGIHTKSP